MSLPLADRFVVRVLIGLEIFGAVSALVGAVALALNGAGVPLEYLANSPFSSFAVPGLLLGAVIGGTQIVAAVALIARKGQALLFSVIAGFGMLIWIFAELAIIRHYSWLQAVYFVHGGAHDVADQAVCASADAQADAPRLKKYAAALSSTITMITMTYCIRRGRSTPGCRLSSMCTLRTRIGKMA